MEMSKKRKGISERVRFFLRCLSFFTHSLRWNATFIVGYEVGKGEDGGLYYRYAGTFSPYRCLGNHQLDNTGGYTVFHFQPLAYAGDFFPPVNLSRAGEIYPVQCLVLSHAKVMVG